MAFLGPSLRRKKVFERPLRRVAAAALVSIAANAGILLVLALMGAFDVPKPTKTEKVELAQLTAKEWERNRTVAKLPGLVPAPVEEEKQIAPPPEPEAKEEKPRGQVVDTGPSNDQRPDDARHLSERNNRVEKETRSRWQGSGNFRNRGPSPIVGETEKQRGGQRGGDERSREAREGQRGTNQKGGKPTPEAASPGDRLALLDRPTVPLTRPDRAARSGSDEDGVGIPGLPGEAQEERRRSGDPQLLPSLDDMARITAGPSLDALDRDIEEGEVTALNTGAYRFATFWNRFKQDVGDHWFPGVRYAIGARDPAGAVFGPSERVTGLRIVLDGSGAVKEIEVVSPSGLDFLDRVAIKSVRDAAPFYNIPPALLDGKGELSFEFGFLVGPHRGIPIRPRWERSP